MTRLISERSQAVSLFAFGPTWHGYDGTEGEAHMRTSGALPTPPLDLLSGSSLFLDFDGTLVDIAETPGGVQVGERLRELLTRALAGLNGRVAVISGRDAAEVGRMIGLPSLGIAGSHGLDIQLPDGRVMASGRPGTLDDALNEFRTFAKSRPGLLVEDKPFGTALHYRRCPEAGAECLQLAQAMADRWGLHLQTGKMVVELRAPDGDKGSALRQLMLEPGMAGTRPVFMGDDDTDEVAFAAAEELGGCGILVGDPRPTAARYRLADVAAALDWLEAACPP